MDQNPVQILRVCTNVSKACEAAEQNSINLLPTFMFVWAGALQLGQLVAKCNTSSCSVQYTGQIESQLDQSISQDS